MNDVVQKRKKTVTENTLEKTDWKVKRFQVLREQISISEEIEGRQEIEPTFPNKIYSRLRLLVELEK